VRTDPLWEGFVPFMLDHGFMAAWSLPILAPADGRLLGTFGVYHDRPHDPAPDEMDLVELHVYLAALAVERHESDRRLRYQAEHDALTGLLGRDAFFRRLADAMRAAGPSEPVALALLDVDGLQQVN